ncbi:MAG: WD40 repeat domain-containing protein [Chthonomonadales bacterium]
MGSRVLRFLLAFTQALLAAALLWACKAPCAADPGAVAALAFSPDGARLAVGLYRRVVVFDTTTWRPVAEFHNLEDAARALAWHPGGSILAIGTGLPSRSGRVIFWDVSGAGAAKLGPVQQDCVEAIAFGPDGRLCAAGSDDNKVRYFRDWAAGSSTELDEHNDRVASVAFSPRPNAVFLTGAMDKVVKAWDETSGRTVMNFDQSPAGITGLAFLPNGDQFVGSALDGWLRWWSISYNAKKRAWSGSLYRAFEAHNGAILALGVSRNGTRLVTGGMDAVVTVWDAGSGGRMRDFKEAQHPVYAVALNPEGKLAAAGGRDGVVWIWDVDGNKLVQTLTFMDERVEEMPAARPQTPRSGRTR